MAKQSAGILVYRKKDNSIEVFLVHPGGPFWKNKDDYAWSIPKGEYQDGEVPLGVAKREFEEEVGQPAPEGEYVELGKIKQTNNKIVTAWAIEKDLGKVEVKSNTFALEWPPKSGKMLEVPEADRAEWFEISTASRKVHPGQPGLLKHLAEKLKIPYTDQSNGSTKEKLTDTQTSLL